MRSLILAALLLLPVSATALDCTPFQTFSCEQGYFDVLDGQPGEVVCGVDFTGWTLHVIEINVTQAGYMAFQGISASSAGNIVATTIMMFDDCGTDTCLDSATSPDGIASLELCLDVGTYKFLVASDTTAPGAFMNIGLSCFDCADVIQWGISCVYCDPVSNEPQSWGSLKSTFH